MKIYTYAICWNEELRLQWYLEHYSFADKHFIYDNGSTDRTLEIARANPKVTVIPFGNPKWMSNSEYLKVKNNCWKKADADWVIVGDIDELLYHHSFETLLRTDTTIFLPYLAYSLISEETPKHYKEMTHGYLDPGYMKACLFKPSALKEINYSPGCHKLSPKGNHVTISHGEGLIMYHCAYNGFETTVNRYAACKRRKCREDIEKKWGVQYDSSREDIRAFFDRHIAGSTKVTRW